MFVSWSDEGSGAVAHTVEEPTVLCRRHFAPAQEVDPLSEDVLRRYRSYADELLAQQPPG